MIPFPNRLDRRHVFLIASVGCLCVLLAGCGRSEGNAQAQIAPQNPTVAVTKVVRKNMARDLTLSSELVPYQEIDVYAKQAGYVKELYVDYGSRVKKGQVLAILEIPELEVQLKQDDAMVRNAQERGFHSEQELR